MCVSTMFRIQRGHDETLHKRALQRLMQRKSAGRVVVLAPATICDGRAPAVKSPIGAVFALLRTVILQQWVVHIFQIFRADAHERHLVKFSRRYEIRLLRVDEEACAAQIEKELSIFPLFVELDLNGPNFLFVSSLEHTFKCLVFVALDVDFEDVNLAISVAKFVHDGVQTVKLHPSLKRIVAFQTPMPELHKRRQARAQIVRHNRRVKRENFAVRQTLMNCFLETEIIV
mmetsp:Transcript_2090/g.5625  ORF Transcript_2090/g.5625 Transcript_2090/m.5625 type:complete len:230 (+) Transcript_2090:347-1036(+)